MALLGAFALPLSGQAADQTGHFHPKGKPPSEHTLKVLKEARTTLPFSDTRDFEEEKKGFIAAPDSWQIMADAGNVAWDMERYKFFLQGKDFDSIHPSLQRQSTLNMNYGLYKVMDNVYQVRGFDLANITFIKGDTGWIIFDPLTAEETARAALKLAEKHLGKMTIKAVVYSHSHGDHWGGVRGVVDQADVQAGKVQIIAPRDFMSHAISENVYAGNAMNRRLFYQYGILLPASPYGHAGQGLAQNVSIGNVTLIAPTRIIEDDLEELTVDGVKMVFQNTPNTEAPSEMNTWFPVAPPCGTHCAGQSISTRRCSFSARMRKSCSPRTTGRAGATTAFRRCCAASVTSTPTSTTRYCTWRIRASPSTRFTTCMKHRRVLPTTGSTAATTAPLSTIAVGSSTVSSVTGMPIRPL
jgi:alkyl sulfatase BDS1-like metallo-beta-lactamase superfamily hydrolase